MAGRQTLSCKMDFSDFPFDSHKCKVGLYVDDYGYDYVNFTFETNVEELTVTSQRSLQYEV